jgi:crossover junction endodeoxyribonuclease RuvC
MRVLGVDPGLTRCGVGIVEGAIGSPISLVGVGVILTPTDAALDQRLLDLDPVSYTHLRAHETN